MKKIIIAGLVVIVAVVLGVVLITSSKEADKSENLASNTTSTNDNTSKSQNKSACELLTLEDAKSLIGDNATLVDGSGEGNAATTENVTVDNCTYSAEGATLGDLTQLTIQIQYGNSAQVKQAYENYRNEFPGDDLPGLGDEAYYATEAKQVQILKDNYWIYVAGGSINAGDVANKELELKAGQLALEKL